MPHGNKNIKKQENSSDLSMLFNLSHLSESESSESETENSSQFFQKLFSESQVLHLHSTPDPNIQTYINRSPPKDTFGILIPQPSSLPNYNTSSLSLSSSLSSGSSKVSKISIAANKWNPEFINGLSIPELKNFKVKPRATMLHLTSLIDNNTYEWNFGRDILWDFSISGGFSEYFFYVTSFPLTKNKQISSTTTLQTATTSDLFPTLITLSKTLVFESHDTDDDPITQFKDSICFVLTVSQVSEKIDRFVHKIMENPNSRIRFVIPVHSLASIPIYLDAFERTPRTKPVKLVKSHIRKQMKHKSTVDVILPTTTEFLTSIPGISKAIASEIVTHFNTTSLSQLLLELSDATQDNLLTINGMTKSRIEKIKLFCSSSLDIENYY